MMQETAVLVGAVASVIVLITLGKLSRQLDQALSDVRAMQKGLTGFQELFKAHRERMEAKANRLIEARGRTPGEIAWKG